MCSAIYSTLSRFRTQGRRPISSRVAKRKANADKRGLLAFTPLPGSLLGAIALLVVAYLLLVPAVKSWFYRQRVAVTVSDVLLSSVGLSDMHLSAAIGDNHHLHIMRQMHNQAHDLQHEVPFEQRRFLSLR
jgi:hypothetical protein